jgi:hypothetical protein
VFLEDDEACGEIDCSAYFMRSGDDRVTGTKTCFRHQSLLTGRCAPEGLCHSPNSVACENAPLEQEPQMSCGLCQSLVGCADGIEGSCGEMRPGTTTGASCGTGTCQSSETCASGGFAVCTPGEPSTEICSDGLDQNCDGADDVCTTNDTPSGALDISHGGAFIGDISEARNDHDPTSGSCGALGGRDVFFEFTLPSPEVVYLQTFGSQFDTVLRVFSGSCTESGALLQCVDDACSQLAAFVALELGIGQYCVVLDQFSELSSSGSYILEFVRTVRTGEFIGLANTTLAGSLAGSTANGSNQSTPSCGAAGDAPDSGYYFLTCPELTYTVGASTCDRANWDTILSLRSGGIDFEDVACNDDGCTTSQSSLSGVRLNGPNIHWLVVDGSQGASGEFVLDYSIATP